MKKLLMALAMLLVASTSWAAGSCSYYPSQSSGSDKYEGYKIIMTCTADVSDGSFPNTTITLPTMSYFYSVEYAHGSVNAVTDGTSLVLNNSFGLDVLGTAGSGALGATTHVLFVPLKSDGGEFFPQVGGTLTQTITQAGSPTNEATLTLEYSFSAIH